MQLFYDFIPIFLFFIAYKLFNIYVATGVAIIASFLQVSFCFFRHHKIDKMQLITLILITLLGGATLLLHNPIFIKWKPSAIYWVFAVLFLGSQWFTEYPLIYHIMGKQIDLPNRIWHRLNISWVFFFTAMGMLNIYVAYHFNTNDWVNFKLFGIMGLTLLFVVAQAFYLARYAT